MKHIKKRMVAITLMLCLCYLMTDVCTVMASGAKSTTTSNNHFVMKEDLVTNSGKIVFGKNAQGSEQEWYLAGSDSKITGENVVIVAAEPIADGQAFESEGKRNEKDSDSWKDCTYSDSASIAEVHPNHYGVSDLRAALNEILKDNFSATEQALLNETTISTFDTRNRVDYTTEDKLYALSCTEDGTLHAGSDDTITIEAKTAEWFWLRTPNLWMENKGDALTACAGNTESSVYVEFSRGVLPASNLNVSSVLFASAASAEKSGKIDNNVAMVLRMDGKDKSIGTATFDKETGNIAVSTTKVASLIVLDDDGKYYVKSVNGTETITKKMITVEVKDSLDKCTIWLESTEDGIAYATMATPGSVPDAPATEGDNNQNSGDTTSGTTSSGGNSKDKSEPTKVGTYLAEKTDKATETGKVTVLPANGKNANTGDQAPIIGLVVLAVVSLGAVIYMKKRKGQNRT